MRSKKQPIYRAFSLIEVAVAIVVIGILLVGILAANNLVTNSRLRTAENLTKSSPVTSIKENVLWLETSLGDSINDSEASDGNAISVWNDQNNSGNRASVVAVGLGPVYANTINRVHAVKFAGSTANYLQISNASFLNNTDYTIVVLEKRQSNSSNNYFIGESPTGSANQVLSLGYSADATVIHSQGSGTSYNSSVTAYNDSVDKPRLFVFTHSSTVGNKTYINGLLAAQDAAKTDHLFGLSTLAIGKGYTGEIGEIAVFTKALNNEARVAVEDYLSQKWNRTNLRKSTSNGACISGTVTDKGCSSDCSTSSLGGVTSPSTIVDGASGVTATCGATGYSGTITVSCSLGNISPSANCSCDTANGYSLVGGVCVKQCSVSVNGSSTTTVSAGVTQVACNAGGNYSTNPFTFSACNGAAISGSCSCVTGYTGATCSSCDTANNYQMISGTCQKGCIVPAGSGTTKTAVAAGSTSTSCDVTGSGTLQYTCDNSGVFYVTAECPQPCTITGAGNTTDNTTIPGKVIHKFTTNGTFQCPTTRSIEILVVGGGGAGGVAEGCGGSGGGGAGGVVYYSSYTANASPYNIVFGNGGAASSSKSSNGANGADSSFGSITAKGGGGGGRYNAALSPTTTAGSVGGSGGGAATFWYLCWRFFIKSNSSSRRNRSLWIWRR